jgi:hypothetical protein
MARLARHTHPKSRNGAVAAGVDTRHRFAVANNSATPEPMGIALLSTGVLGFLQQDEGRLSDGVGWTTAYGQEIGGCGGGLDVVELSTLVDG